MVYKIINAIFSKNGSEYSAAEAHGMATGMLCTDEKADSSKWLADLFSYSKTPIDEQKNLLIRLFDETKRLLNSDGFEFELFLPEDEKSLTERVEALKSWCRGFLYSIGSSKASYEWPDDVLEIVKDITEFTKLESLASGEEDEQAYTEITEYLRSAVVLLSDDLYDLEHSKIGTGKN